jgi:hypothetical protein
MPKQSSAARSQCTPGCAQSGDFAPDFRQTEDGKGCVSTLTIHASAGKLAIWRSAARERVNTGAQCSIAPMIIGITPSAKARWTCAAGCIWPYSSQVPAMDSIPAMTSKTIIVKYPHVLKLRNHSAVIFTK